MRLLSRRQAADHLPGVTGTLRMDRRTGSLLQRLEPGDIAVIDHLDLDQANAEALVDRGVVAVVNASPMISGRYPNRGPEVLASSGVVMVDGVGSAVFGRLHDGARARVHDGRVLVGDDPVVTGRALDDVALVALLDEARSGLPSQVESLAHNTAELLRRDRDLLLHGHGLPETLTRFEGRPVVVVVPAHDHRQELRRLRRFVAERRPVLVGVDALLEAGHRPDVVVVTTEAVGGGGRASHGVSDRVSDRALTVARDVVLHTDGSDRAAADERLHRLGVHHTTVAAPPMGEDLALLLADVRGASLLVAVGGHTSLEDFLDGKRAGLASTFLTRLRVGPKLVDARSVAALNAGQVRLWQVVLVLLVGLLALALAVATTPDGAQWWSAATDQLGAALGWARRKIP
jgi:uncharacterized membrane-anchored protein